MRNIVFHPQGWEDLTYWATADKKMLRRLTRLIEEARRTPFEGTGKPEPLRRKLSGFWSRRIDDEHRLVYGATDAGAIVLFRGRGADHHPGPVPLRRLSPARPPGACGPADADAANEIIPGGN